MRNHFIGPDEDEGMRQVEYVGEGVSRQREQPMQRP